MAGTLRPEDSASAACSSAGVYGNSVYDSVAVASAAVPEKVLLEILASGGGVEGVNGFMEQWTSYLGQYTAFVTKSASANHAFVRVASGGSSAVGVPTPAATVSRISGRSGSSFSRGPSSSFSRGSRFQALGVPAWKSSVSWRPKSPVPDGMCYLKAFAAEYVESAGVRLGEWPTFSALFSESWQQFESLESLLKFRVVPRGESAYHVAVGGVAGVPVAEAAAGLHRSGPGFPSGSVGALLASTVSPPAPCEGFCLDVCDCPGSVVPGGGLLLSDRVGGRGPIVGRRVARFVAAPDVVPVRGDPVVYLAGSMEKNESDGWRTELLSMLASERCCFASPRRETGLYAGTGPVVWPEARVRWQWEMAHLGSADVVVVNFLPCARSAVSMLELGALAGRKRVCVVCPEEFDRSEYVEWFCRENGFELCRTLASAGGMLKAMIDGARSVPGRVLGRSCAGRVTGFGVAEARLTSSGGVKMRWPVSVALPVEGSFVEADGLKFVDSVCRETGLVSLMSLDDLDFARDHECEVAHAPGRYTSACLVVASAEATHELSVLAEEYEKLRDVEVVLRDLRPRAEW